LLLLIWRKRRSGADRPSFLCFSGARPAAVGEGTTAAAVAPSRPRRGAPRQRHRRDATGATKTVVRARGAQSSGAAVIARGAQTVWPSPPVHRPTVCSPVPRVCSPVPRLRHSLTSLALATQLRLNCDWTPRTCDSPPTCDWTCDSLLSALSKVVISASATSQGTGYRLHPKAIVTAPKSKALTTHAYNC